MKKLIASILCLGLLFSIFTTSAAAFDYDAFWEENYDALSARGIELYGQQEFREGLMPVLVEGKWNYINENLEVVDLNQGRFVYVFAFSEGQAAVMDEGMKVGYIDTSGNLVIPCQFSAYHGMGDVWVGYFHDGKATVLGEDAMISFDGQPAPWKVGEIDTSGNLVTPYADAESGTEGKYMQCDNGYFTDYVAPEEPVAPGPDVTEPETPEPPQQDPSVEVETVLATPTASKVVVNGTEISFDAYNIADFNYFKLRDIAMALNGSETQFEVSWDESVKAINLLSDQPYTVAGGELELGDGTVQQATLNTSKIYLNGEEIQLTAYTINGYNYFKLRDLGKAIDFGVGWDGTLNTISIDSSAGYTE